MTDARVYGHTRSGQPITDTEVQALAAEAETGYDVDELIARRPKRGRPALGSSPASTQRARLQGDALASLDALDRCLGLWRTNVSRDKPLPSRRSRAPRTGSSSRRSSTTRPRN